MKIYTKTGDSGETGLVGGKRIGKDSLRICAYGEVDELNALLGVCRALNPPKDLADMLHRIQRELFDLGADLATPLDSKVPVPRVQKQQIGQLERWIDQIDEKLPPLRNFVLPGGCLLASNFHVARTVCRRAERAIVSLQKSEGIGENIVVYMNRLSDLLFVMARLANTLENVNDELWSGEIR